MNFTIEAKELQTELSKAKKIINSVHTPLSAARGILFEAEEDKLFMNINNLETEYRTELNAQIIRTGKALIDFKILNDIVSGFEEEIEFDEEENRWFLIKSGKSSSHVVGLDTDDFPAMLTTEEFPTKPGFINAHELCRVFKNAAVLKTPSEETRHHLKTILLEEREPGKLLVKSTDSASLYVGEVERTGDAELTYHLIDKKAALAITDILKSFGTKDVEVLIAEDRLILNGVISQKTFTGKREKRSSICLRFVDGNWPNTDTIFSSFCAAEFIVEKSVFAKALKKAKAFVNTEYKAGIFVFNRAPEFDNYKHSKMQNFKMQVGRHNQK